MDRLDSQNSKLGSRNYELFDNRRFLAGSDGRGSSYHLLYLRWCSVKYLAPNLFDEVAQGPVTVHVRIVAIVCGVGQPDVVSEDCTLHLARIYLVTQSYIVLVIALEFGLAIGASFCGLYQI